MRVEIRDALSKAYDQLHLIIRDLYIAHDLAVANNDDGASLLVSRSELLYEQAENIEFIISEMEER